MITRTPLFGNYYPLFYFCPLLVLTDLIPALLRDGMHWRIEPRYLKEHIGHVLLGQNTFLLRHDWTVSVQSHARECSHLWSVG